MRKTASTFLGGVLAQELPSGVLLQQKHSDWGKIPLKAAELPVLVYIRNPWDWYVSWYHFNEARGGMPNGYWRMLSSEGTLGFEATVERACTLSTRIMGADLFSTLFRNLVGDGLFSDRLTVGRFELLVAHLESFLGTVGVTLSEGALARIRRINPVNSSNHGPYSDYYGDDLRMLVERSCQPLIERFGYRF